MIKKVKNRGQLKLEEQVRINLGADVLLHGYLEGYYADTEARIGISTNGRIQLCERTWEQFKEKVDSMFIEVKKERGMKDEQ